MRGYWVGNFLINLVYSFRAAFFFNLLFLLLLRVLLRRQWLASAGFVLAYWERPSENGAVNVPFEKAPWSDTFGMCVDRFGTSWLVNASAQPS